MSIKMITEDEAQHIVGKFLHKGHAQDELGKFIVSNWTGVYTAIDNSTNHCWTEDFTTKEQAIRYLSGEDPDDIRKEEENAAV